MATSTITVGKFKKAIARKSVEAVGLRPAWSSPPDPNEVKEWGVTVFSTVSGVNEDAFNLEVQEKTVRFTTDNMETMKALAEFLSE